MEIESAGFRYVQVPSLPPSVLTVPRDAHRHAAALADVLGTSGLRVVLHGPGSVKAGTRDGDKALAGLISYAAEVGASHVVHHAMLPPAKIGALRRPVRLRRSPRPPSASE